MRQATLLSKLRGRGPGAELGLVAAHESVEGVAVAVDGDGDEVGVGGRRGEWVGRGGHRGLDA